MEINQKIITHKNIIIYALESFKRSWEIGGVKNWDYELINHWVDDGKVFRIEIRCGTITKTSIVMMETRISEGDSYNIKQNLVENLWHRAVIEICTAGLVKDYQDVITAHRKGSFPLDSGTSQTHGLNPLTYDECFT